MQTIPTTQTETTKGPKPESQKTTQRALTPVMPAVDVLDSDHEILVLVDVPGVKSADLEIGFEKDLLRFTAKRPSSGIVFERAFDVPPEIDSNGISAELKNGVLELHLPKHQGRSARTIAISAK